MGKLLFLKAGQGVTVSGKKIPQITITRSDGDRHHFAIADRGAYTGVTAKVVTHQRPEAAKAEGKTETQKERETPARTGAPESETGHAEESAKSTGSARR